MGVLELLSQGMGGGREACLSSCPACSSATAPRSTERQATLAERWPEQVVDMDNMAKSSRADICVLVYVFFCWRWGKKLTSAGGKNSNKAAAYRGAVQPGSVLSALVHPCSISRSPISQTRSTGIAVAPAALPCL